MSDKYIDPVFSDDAEHRRVLQARLLDVAWDAVTFNLSADELNQAIGNGYAVLGAVLHTMQGANAGMHWELTVRQEQRAAALPQTYVSIKRLMPMDDRTTIVGLLQYEYDTDSDDVAYLYRNKRPFRKERGILDSAKSLETLIAMLQDSEVLAEADADRILSEHYNDVWQEFPDIAQKEQIPKKQSIARRAIGKLATYFGISE